MRLADRSVVPVLPRFLQTVPPEAPATVLAEKAELAESLAILDSSMRQVRTGRGRDLKQAAIQEIADKLGLSLER